MQFNKRRRLPVAFALAVLLGSVMTVAHAQSIGVALSAEQRATVQSLQSQGARVSFHRKTGKANFISSDRRAYLTVPGASPAQPPQESALAFAKTYAPLFGLKEPAVELTVMRESRNAAGGPSVRFQQVHQGVPVIGGELIVNMDANHSLLSMNGEVLSTDQGLILQPAISANNSSATALTAVAKWYRLDVDALEATNPELSVYDPRLIGPSHAPARLVWRLQIKSKALKPIRELVLIDAQSGAVALHFNQVPDAKNRVTYTANETAVQRATQVCDESSGDACSSGVNLDADAAHLYAGDTYDFYFNTHGRDGIDGAGMAMISTVNWFDTGECPNAFWDGDEMTYCTGLAQADDVVAHELTHGVTENTSNLFYYYQSGAINESLSDVWGEFVDLTNGSGSDTPADRWKVGEDVDAPPLVGAIRDMANPPAFGDPDKMTSANYYTGALDQGGVHSNSGVNNKAVFLMVDGGTFNTVAVTALGITKVAKIYYEAQTQLLTSGSDYLDLYNALYQSCLNLIGTSGITSGDCTEVRDATNAVEMNFEPVAGYNPEATLCPVDQAPVNIAYHDFESGTTGWTFSPPGTWGRTIGYAASGLYSLYAPGVNGIADTRAMVEVNVPVGTSYLHFRHAFDFEFDGGGNYDGGVIEYCLGGAASCSISTDTNWVDASALFDVGAAGGKKYVGPITVTGFGNPLEGRQAFVQSSHGYVSTRLNLSTVANQPVRFRWRSASDSSVSSLAWLVDDVRLYSSCAAAVPAVSVSATDAAAAEAGLDPGTFTVTRSIITASSLTVNFTMSGTATSGADYVAPSGTVTIPANVATATVTITPIEDTVYEGNETAILTLNVGAGYSVGSPASATVTIADNEPIVSVTATDAAAAEAGLDPGTITVTRSVVTTSPLTVNYTMSGTATSGTDYTAVSGSVIIPASAATATVTITPIDDAIYEGNQTAILTLSADPSYGVGSPSSATVTIADDEPPPPSSKGGCFIATAAYGTPMADDVRYLRAFRDEYLQTNNAGRWIVTQYYRYSPPLADYLRQNDGLRSVVRGALSPLIGLSRAMVSDSALAAQTADRP